MKLVLKVSAVLLVLLALGSLYYTHTKAYVTNAYEQTIVKACNGENNCLLFGSMLEIPVVECMQKQLFSTSEKTVIKCLVQSVKEITKE